MPKLAKEMGALAVRRLTKPGRYAVGGVAGLCLFVGDNIDTRTGQRPRSWILRITPPGRKDRAEMGLGSYPELTLEKAREKAGMWREQVENGIDPRDEVKEAKRKAATEVNRQKTFRVVATEAWTIKKAEFVNEKHAAQWINTLTTYAFPTIGDMLLDDIEVKHVHAVLEPIWTTKTETATRVRERMQHVFLHGRTIGAFTRERNPATLESLGTLLPKAEKLKRRKRRHFPALPWMRMNEFMAELAKEDTIGARCLEFCIITAARSNEGRGATWGEIDLKRKEWKVPANRMNKNNLEHRVPLTADAIDLLKRLPRYDGCDLVFPGPYKHRILSDNTLGKVVNRICAKLDGQPIATPHGFRSSFKDWARNQPNHNDDATELALAHVSTDETRTAYARDELFEVRRPIMNDWMAHIYARKVTKMKKRAA